MKKIYAYFVTGVLTITGALYIIAPAQLMNTALGSYDTSVLNMIRSCGGLYLGVAAFIMILMRKQYIQEAILGVNIAMLGLILGRLISIVNDGTPNIKMIVSLILEIAIACVGLVINKGISKQKK